MQSFFINSNIVYIDCIDSYADSICNRWPKWLRWCIYQIMKFGGYVQVKENFLTLYCTSKDITHKKALVKLHKKLTELKAQNIVCADCLMDNKAFMSFLYEKNYNVLNGNWLYRFLQYDVLQKIAYIKNVDVSKLEVSILAKDNKDIIVENAKIIGKNCKILNIITDKIENYLELEKYFSEQYGILINVSSNKEKSCTRSNVIFNFDLKEKELKECKFNKDSILVQVNGKRFERRDGVTICSSKISIPKKILKEKEHFDAEILYESEVYSKISFENMRKILKRDNIRIRYFVGNNGKINFNEIAKST